MSDQKAQVKTAELTVGKYKHGKQTQVMPFELFQEKMQKAQLSEEATGYIWLLFYAGVRKSEGFERVVSDTKISPEHFTIDFHKRKKGGATVDPLDIPRAWPGVEILIDLTEKARARKPLTKMIFYYEMQKRQSKLVKDQWIFPNIQSTEAWRIVKRVLGKEFYPHFLRLNRLTDIGTDESCNIVRMKSFSGIKTIRILEGYIGVSKKQQNQAIDFIGKSIKPFEKKKERGPKDGSRN